MDPKKRRLLYTLIAIAVVILLIIAVIYVGRHGTGGLFEANPSASSSPNTGEEDEPDVKTETLQEVKNPYEAVDPTTALAPDLATVKKELSSLPVKERASKNGYSREQFGAAWEDVDKNGCNTRDDILRRGPDGCSF